MRILTVRNLLRRLSEAVGFVDGPLGVASVANSFFGTTHSGEQHKKVKRERKGGSLGQQTIIRDPSLPSVHNSPLHREK